MQEAFIAFLRHPVRENFLGVRDQVIADPRYDPYSSDLDDIEALYREQKFEDLRSRCLDTFPNLLLSSRLHLLASLAERKLGDNDNADVELAISQQCLAGILSTGDGSENSPFLVLRTSDIYDLLLHLDKSPQEQSLRHQGERSFDVMRCADGSEYWFEITASFQKLALAGGPAGVAAALPTANLAEALPEDFEVAE